MDKFNVRDVNDREIYESYMGILRISPNSQSGAYNPSNLVDDATSALTNLGGDEIKLSDSDGNPLGLSFKPMAFNTNITTYKDKEDKWLINIQSNVENTVFAVKSVSIRSVLHLKAFKTDTLSTVSPLHCYSKDMGKLCGLFYPTESPYVENYFNNPIEKIDIIDDDNGNKQIKDSRIIQSKNAEERDKLLKEQSEEWYKNYKTELENEYVKVGGKIVYQENNEGESIPVLYTHDKILAHGHGASYRTNNKNPESGLCLTYEENIQDKFKITNINEGGIFTHLCWADFDKLVWSTLENALNGNIRHISGRYTNLGASVDTDLRKDLGIKKDTEDDFSIAKNKAAAYSLKATAPLVGLDVPAGNILYNAIPPTRYFFYLAKQIARNITDLNITESENATISSVINLKNDSYIEPFAKKDIHFAANLIKNFALCDGNKVSFDSYPGLNLDNDFINITNDTKDGTLKEGGKYSGEGYIYNALAASSISFNTTSTDPDNDSDTNTNTISNTKNYINTLPLIKFNSKSSVFLRGATWENINKINDGYVLTANESQGDSEYNKTFSINELSSPTTYNVKINDDLTINRAIKENTLYPFSIAHSLKTYSHYHNIFSSSSGIVGENRNTAKGVAFPPTNLESATAALYAQSYEIIYRRRYPNQTSSFNHSKSIYWLY